MRTDYIDQGGFVDQTLVTPGRTYTALRWVPGSEYCDPATGGVVRQRGGLAWVPFQGPTRTDVQRVWQPNVVAQQTPQTTYVQRQVTQMIPIQVMKYVNEEVVRKVPIQVQRIVQEEQVRRVPVTTTRQVVERVEQKVPVQVCRTVEEEVVRRVPVTTCRLVYEEKVEQTPVQVCRMVTEQETIQVARVVEKQVPITYTCRVPRVVEMRSADRAPLRPGRSGLLRVSRGGQQPVDLCARFAVDERPAERACGRPDSRARSEPRAFQRRQLQQEQWS